MYLDRLAKCTKMVIFKKRQLCVEENRPITREVAHPGEEKTTEGVIRSLPLLLLACFLHPTGAGNHRRFGPKLSIFCPKLCIEFCKLLTFGPIFTLWPYLMIFGQILSTFWSKMIDVLPKNCLILFSNQRIISFSDDRLLLGKQTMDKDL